MISFLSCTGSIMISRQLGISLLEVLVGFVIFTSSLVAVLEYVSGQVYHYHLSSRTQQKVQMIYDLAVISDLGIEEQLNQANNYVDFDWTINSSAMDTLGQEEQQQEQQQLLNRTTYSVIDDSNTFEWTVLKIKKDN